MSALQERPGSPAPADLAERRESIWAGVAQGAWRVERPPVEGALGGVRVLRFKPAGPSRGRVLHFHGGGYCLGFPEMIAPYAAALAERCAVEVVLAAYRLAPEHPCPAGILDALSAYAALRAEGDSPIIISGDSAGGGIATGATAKLAADGAPPAGLVAHSPWLDVTCEADSYNRNADTDPLFSLAAAQMMAGFYLQGLSPRDPFASPLFADVAGFPPTFLSVGGGEVLTDDTLSFERRLKAAGVDVSVLNIAGMEHVAITRDLALPGAMETFEATAAFIDKRTGAPAS